jgi:hypothetical protein
MRTLRLTFQETSPTDLIHRAERVITMRELKNFKHLGYMLEVIVEDLEKDLDREINKRP